MSEQKKYPMKLTDTFRFGKHKGQTVQWVIDNDIDYMEYLLRNKIIALHPFAWDEFMAKRKPKGNQVSGNTIYRRYHKRSH